MRLQQSSLYDALMRLPMLGWTMLIATVSMGDLARYAGKPVPIPSTAIYAINIVMRLSTIGFFLLAGASVVLRWRPAGKARGAEPRISALIGSFVVYAFGLFPRRELSPAAEVASTMLVLAGSGGALCVLIELGRSFSLMAEARRLVTAGVYRIVRHPLYLAEEIATVGVLMQFLCFWTLLLLAVQIGFQLRRMRNEEVLLAGVFPEYAAYKARTARLVPGIC